MYEYACGGWESSARMPESRSSWGIIEEMAARATRDQTRIVAMFSHQPSQVQTQRPGKSPCSATTPARYRQKDQGPDQDSRHVQSPA